ncbi:hypothetical protein J1N35_011175 [Gossypium stocksii]|uniref:Reverse transcriptase n=1 Tax=Gossypium stocksii TaxID=47602 RepID=A0A9D3W2B0_9ROSI|nr:hypothetical protein J1N35_011175 [Gossypium stocksii]
MLKLHNPQVVFFMETKIGKRQMEEVRRRCGFFNGIDVEAVGSRGGLCLAWKGDISIRFQSFSIRHIDVVVDEVEKGTKWRFTGFYGSPYQQEREVAWDLLRQLHVAGGLPWILSEDFNEILYGFEKKGGLPQGEGRMETFRRVLEDCNLSDIGFYGNWFTWERDNLPDTNIQKRLDRAVATEGWLNLFPNYQLRHLSHSFSDHCPLLINTFWEDRRYGSNLDKQDKYCANLESCKSFTYNTIPSISLCNMLYKLIAKVIANHLRNVMDKCIDVAQSAFVPGRLIFDNVILASELLHTLKHKRAGKKGFMAVKLDMSMAYDRVEWSFVEGIMKKMGFDSNWGWRLITYPNSLLARVLKAKYYPSTDFLNARLRNLPSLTWRNIWSARGLLEKGLCWRVGKGDRISIWEDLWLPGNEGENLQHLRRNADIELVSDLIEEESRTWKVDLLFSTFDADLAGKILQIPLARSAQEDFQVWGGEPSGNFSVRSAYKLLQRTNLVPSNNIIQTETAAFYRKLGNLNIHLKIKITIWRISWDYIPMLANLKLKRVVNDAWCPRCRQFEEDSDHFFRRCPIMKEVWSHLHFSWVLDNNIHSMWEWLTWVFIGGTKDQCQLFCCGL